MRENFGDLKSFDYNKLKELQSILRYYSGNTDTTYILQILQNLEGHLDLLFDHVLEKKALTQSYGRSSYKPEYRYSGLGTINHSEIKEVLEDIFSTHPHGILQTLIRSIGSQKMSNQYKLHLKYFPRHAQIYIQKNQQNNYMNQFFGLLNHKNNVVQRQGNEIYILLTQEEYFLFVFLYTLSRFGLETTNFSKDSYSMNPLGKILLDALNDYLMMLIYSERAKTQQFKSFKRKLMLFLEDYTIIPTLLESLSKSSSSANYLQAIPPTNSSNIMMFRMFNSLIKAEQHYFYHNSMKMRRFGKVFMKSKIADNFFSFSTRVHDFCIEQMKKWRRDNRIKLAEMGEVLLFFFNPLNILNEVGPQMIEMKRDNANVMQLDRIRMREREKFLAQSTFIEAYVKKNILIYCHLFSAFIMIFSAIVDMVSPSDINILFEILKLFMVSNKNGKTPTILYGAIELSTFQEWMNQAKRDSPLARDKKIDLNVVDFYNSKVVKNFVVNIIKNLSHRNATRAKDCIGALKEIFGINSAMLKNLSKSPQRSTGRGARSDWENEYIEKYQVLWQDPWRNYESKILYYCLAIPVGHIIDLFRYRIRSIPVQKEATRVKYEGYRIAQQPEKNQKWYPGTNMRILAKYEFVLSWFLIIVVGIGVLYMFAYIFSGLARA